MTAQQEKDLREMQAKLVEADASPWQPRCISDAFAAPPDGSVDLTLQAWIDLDAARSPFLPGAEWPAADPIAQLRALERAWPIVTGTEIGLAKAGFTPTRAMECVAILKRVVARAFSMALPLDPPKEMTADGEEDGFGQWLPLLTVMMAELNYTRHAALGEHVARAFALVAALRHTQGWRVAGANYRQREVVKEAA